MTADDLGDDATGQGEWADPPPPRPPGVDALQAAAREAIDATRALLDVAEAMVEDPDVAERLGSIVRSVSAAAARAARTAGSATGRDGGSGGPDDGDDDVDGVEHISVS